MMLNKIKPDGSKDPKAVKSKFEIFLQKYKLVPSGAIKKVFDWPGNDVIETGDVDRVEMEGFAQVVMCRSYRTFMSGNDVGIECVSKPSRGVVAKRSFAKKKLVLAIFGKIGCSEDRAKDVYEIKNCCIDGMCFFVKAHATSEDSMCPASILKTMDVEGDANAVVQWEIASGPKDAHLPQIHFPRMVNSAPVKAGDEVALFRPSLAKGAAADAKLHVVNGSGPAEPAAKKARR